MLVFQNLLAKLNNFFFNLDYLHARLKNDWTTWSYKKKKHKKTKAYRKAL